MKLFSFAVLAAVLFLLPASAHAAASDSQPVIACFGDSLTAGHGAAFGHAYPDYLQQLLDARGYRYRVVNKGISGDTTKDGLARVKDVLAAHPAIVVVEFGGNDGLRGLPITATRANLDQIIALLKDAGVKVVLAGITLPPDYGPDYIRDFNQTYALAAKKFNIPLLPFLYAHVYTVPGTIQADGIHATAKGNQLVAENVFGLLRPLLKK
ncbi:arylesterase [Silvibacterium dinghuense]|uniref:arylesterase n=1 Tax=Silvibacterium dinghuense TaxID=1560006 RepID=UPI0019837CD6|nr:arylesterase [Silvibacterium dinghuense]GGH11772.1 arylesterase [Silvibacterium dinghuense]